MASINESQEEEEKKEAAEGGVAGRKLAMKVVNKRMRKSRTPAGQSLPATRGQHLHPGRWFYISDSRVNEISEAAVLKSQAYILFYERIF